MQPPSLQDLNEARELVNVVARKTPVVAARWLGEGANGPVWLKCENLQRAGSFKVRGAYVRMARLTPQARSKGVVAASAGNHAQGVAVAAAELGVPATVFMPRAASLPKIAATRGYGASVELVGDIIDDALSTAQAFAVETGAELIHPFDHRDIIAGQASVGLEICEQVVGARTILVPTGGGGLLAGVAAAVAASGSGARVVGVQASGAAAYPRSLESGRPIRLESMATMADGIAVAQPGAVPLELVSQLAVEVVTVSEDAIARALVLLMERSKQVVEPAGAPGVAALLERPGVFEPPIVVVLSGGNVDPVLLLRLLRYGLSAAGRYLSVTVRIADRPGSLAALLALLADVGVNVLEVDHVWTDPGLAIGQVEVLVQVETRGVVHRADVVELLRKGGYELVIAGSA